MRKILLMSAALMLGSHANVGAGTITFTNTQASNTGTGFGSITNVLSLQKNGSEFGAVFPGLNKQNKFDPNLTTGDATNQSQTVTAADLISLVKIPYVAGQPIDFSIIFQVNMAGQKDQLTLNDFQLDFWNANGTAKVTPSVVYDAPVGGLQFGGVGVGSSGWIFNVHLTAAEADAFFGSGTNRFGMSILQNQAITGTNDGPENFYIAANQSIVVPEPTTLSLAAFGLMSMAGYGWRRRMTRASWLSSQCDRRELSNSWQLSSLVYSPISSAPDVAESINSRHGFVDAAIDANDFNRRIQFSYGNVCHSRATVGRLIRPPP